MPNYKSDNQAVKPESISIVVPMYNEESTIESLLNQLEPYRSECEIILVDGGSTDSTLSMIPQDWTVLHSGNGRGHQLNDGAKASSGDILFFLHCDSIIPENVPGQIRKVMSEYDMGFFGVKFDSNDWVMGVCGRQSNRRAKYRQIPFGDQGIFLRRWLFEKLGGFPEIPLMEDYQFSLSARESGVKMGQTESPIITSARRYGKGFFHQLWVMYFMHKLRYLYRHGTPAEVILQRYRDMR